MICILVSFVIITNSCTDQIYTIKITNRYFEPLHNVNLGLNIHCDTLLVNSYTKTYSINQGKYTFSSVTESGLEIEAKIDMKGNMKTVNLIINEQGQLYYE